MTSELNVALVTGGASGIGWSVVARLVEEGAHVVIADKSEKGLDQARHEFGGSVSCHLVDVSVSDDVDSLFDSVVDEHGSLDILVNGAARSFYAPTVDFPDDEWDEAMRSLKGYFLCARSAARLMIPNQRGSIINISSIAAHVGLAGTVAHATAKGGVEAMTRVLAVECAPHNVRVNAIAPGPIETPGSRAALTPMELEQRRARIPMGVLGKPQDVAGAVAFLVSEDSAWMCGSVIVVDGGYTILGSMPADHN